MNEAEKYMVELMTSLLNSGVPRQQAYETTLSMEEEIRRSINIEASKKYNKNRRLKRWGIDNQ